MTDWKTNLLQNSGKVEEVDDEDELEEEPEDQPESSDTPIQPDELSDATRKLLFLEERQAIALEEISENLVKLIKALQTASNGKPEEVEKEKEVEKEEEKKEEEGSGLND